MVIIFLQSVVVLELLMDDLKQVIQGFFTKASMFLVDQLLSCTLLLYAPQMNVGFVGCLA